MPKLHVVSVAFGVGVAGLLALTTSQASPPPASLNPASIRIEYMPHPRDMVQIKQEEPFTVPVGKIFVLTGMGATNSYESFVLTVDGLPGVMGGSLNNPDADCSVVPVPLGFTVQAGATIGLAGPPTARAWGYLASQ